MPINLSTSNPQKTHIYITNHSNHFRHPRTKPSSPQSNKKINHTHRYLIHPIHPCRSTPRTGAYPTSFFSPPSSRIWIFLLLSILCSLFSFENKIIQSYFLSASRLNPAFILIRLRAEMLIPCICFEKIIYMSYSL